MHSGLLVEEIYLTKGGDSGNKSCLTVAEVPCAACFVVFLKTCYHKNCNKVKKTRTKLPTLPPSNKNEDTLVIFWQAPH